MKWIWTTGIPLLTTGTQLVQLEHPSLPLVSLAHHWLPVVNNWEHWNTTGTAGIHLETSLGNLLNAD
jgi:hypothetical protein